MTATQNEPTSNTPGCHNLKHDTRTEAHVMPLCLEECARHIFPTLRKDGPKLIFNPGGAFDWLHIPTVQQQGSFKKKKFLEWIVYNWECSSAVITTFHLDTLICSLPPPSFLTLPPLHTPAHISTYKYLYTYTNPRICDLSMWHVEIHALSADMSPFLKQTYLQLSIHPSIHPSCHRVQKGVHPEQVTNPLLANPIIYN